jgi:hypothetical protein
MVKTYNPENGTVIEVENESTTPPPWFKHKHQMIGGDWERFYALHDAKVEKQLADAKVIIEQVDDPDALKWLETYYPIPPTPETKE